MKKIVAVAVITTLLLVGCNDSNSKDKKTESTKSSTETTEKNTDVLCDTLVDVTDGVAELQGLTYTLPENMVFLEPTDTRLVYYITDDILLFVAREDDPTDDENRALTVNQREGVSDEDLEKVMEDIADIQSEAYEEDVEDLKSSVITVKIGNRSLPGAMIEYTSEDITTAALTVIVPIDDDASYVIRSVGNTSEEALGMLEGFN